MTTYYEYHPTYLNWVSTSTVLSGYGTSEYVPVSVGAGQTQTWTGSGWSTTTDYSGVFYFTTSQYSGVSIGQSYYSYSTNEQPSISIGTATAPPTISTTGYRLGWNGTDWTVEPSTLLVPDSDGVVSLGSSTNKFKDIFVSEGTVYLGVHSISIGGNQLEYDGVQVVTGAGGTINTDLADITNLNAGIITTTQIGAVGSGSLTLDGDYIPLHNRVQDLGHAAKSWRKVYIKSGPKAIEFENTGVGIGLTVNAQLENILEFDGHELFAGDGDIGHHGNLRNVYATGIVSATVGAQVGVLTATTITSSGAELLVRTDLVPSADNTYELGSATNRWKDIYLDGGESVLNIGSVSIGATDGHLTVDGNEVAEYSGSGDFGIQGNLRNINLTGIITGYNAGIVTYYGDGNNLDLPVTSGGGGAIATKYKSSSNTTMSDPGKGKWRLNNLTQATATQMAVDVVTSGGYSINALLAAITPGTKIFLQRKDKPEAYFTFVVNTAPTLQGTISDGWYLFPSITNLRDGGTGIADNKDCVLAFKAPNQVSGESITPSTVSVAGSVTAANFYGDGSGITGIAATISAATATNFTWNASLLPDTNEAYDLGSASNKVRHLYLSDSSLYTDSGVLSVGLTTQVGVSSKVLMGNKLKEIVAASVDFADFQAKVAAENFDI